MSILSTTFIITIAIIALIVVLFLICLTGYVKAAPDEAIIISGFKKEPKVLIGKAGIKIPILERKDMLSLKLIPIDVKTSSAVPTADYINITVDATVNVKISNNPDRLALAAENFLNKQTKDVGDVAREVLEGNVREIVGRMKLEEMVSDRQKFANLVKENAEPDLAAMGLDIISFNVQNFMDDNQVIENLGVDNIVKIKKGAAISRAESEKEIKVAQAKADKEANDARVAADTAIAEQNNELELKRSELQVIADTKKAEADAAYNIQAEQQRKTVEVARTEADIAKQEKENELKAKEVEAQEQTLNAEVRKKAEAERFAKQQEADAEKYAKIAQADAELAERKAKADAEKYEAEKNAEAMERNAKAIRSQGEAEAAAIQAKGIAEAEAILKKAEAMKQYGKAAIAEMIVKVLPEMADAISKNVSSIENLTVYDSGSGNGMNAVSGYTPQLLKKTFDTVKSATGVDLSEVLKADTYDAKVNRNVNLSGDIADISGVSQDVSDDSSNKAEETETDGLGI